HYHHVAQLSPGERPFGGHLEEGHAELGLLARALHLASGIDLQPGVGTHRPFHQLRRGKDIFHDTLVRFALKATGLEGAYLPQHGSIAPTSLDPVLVTQAKIELADPLARDCVVNVHARFDHGIRIDTGSADTGGIAKDIGTTVDAVEDPV